MRRIIFFIAGTVLLLLLLAAFTFFLPSKVTVSKSIKINTSDSVVLSQIDNFNSWKKWYPAFRDSDVIVTLPGSHNRSAEMRDKYGRTLFLRMLAESNNKVDVELFVKEKSVITYQIMLMPVSKESTNVTWSAITNLGWYPWRKLQGIVLDKVTGEQYASALESLKTIAESQAVSVPPE